MISDKKLLDFEWPPKMLSFKPKVKKQYRHDVTVLSSANAEYAYTLSFSSEKKANNFIHAAKQSANKPVVEYEKKELPNTTEEGLESV